MMRLRAVMVLLVMVLATLLFATQLLATLAVPARAAKRAVVLDIDGAIGPAVADYVVREITRRRRRPISASSSCA